MDVACAWLLFFFTYDNCTCPCAYIDWYTHVDDSPDADMGIWIVSKDVGHSAVIHIDSIIHCTHLHHEIGETLV